MYYYSPYRLQLIILLLIPVMMVRLNPSPLQTSNPSQNASHVFMPELCNNGLDDDQDGLIDIFDEDCDCKDSIPPNLVPNGDFSQTTGCCANLQESNCLEHWIVTGPSPDYVSDNCPNTDLRPDVRVLSNQFNTSFNDGYIFGIVGSVNNRINTESMGVCLTEPLRDGTPYTLSLDVADLRNEQLDVQLTIYGINRCDSLPLYRTNGGSNFCTLDLPYFPMGTIDGKTLGPGWNTITFTFLPNQDIEAIFYSTNCESVATAGNDHIFMILDNFSIREELDIPMQPEIVAAGIDCSSPLRLTTEELPGYTYQWYKDSVEIVGANNAVLLGEDIVGTSNGIYHLLVTNSDGNCRLSNAVTIERPNSITDLQEEICTGERLTFGNRELSEAGVYWDTLVNAVGCDSIIQLQLEVSALPVDKLAITICKGDTYSFGGRVLTEPGLYRDTINPAGGCAEIIQLQLSVEMPLGSDQFATLCAGDTYVFANRQLSRSGIYFDTLSSSHGCDSVVSLVLEVQEAIIGDTLKITQPDGTSFEYHGNRYVESGLYSTPLQTANGCDSIAYLLLTFVNLDLYIPNAFSPNGDGINDLFQAEGSSEALAQIEGMRIFSRWGDLLFAQDRTSGQIPQWNGMVKGEMAANGVYLYYFLWRDQEGRVGKRTGELMLIR